MKPTVEGVDAGFVVWDFPCGAKTIPLVHIQYCAARLLS